MERLLGARPHTAQDPAVWEETSMHSPRGAPYEEYDEAANPAQMRSALAEALKASNAAHKRAMAQMPTGGPSATHTERTVEASTPGRAPLQVRAVGPDSYRGVGTVERNQKRAAHRAQQRAKRRAKSSS